MGSFSFNESKSTQCITVELIWQLLDFLQPMNLIGQFKQNPSVVTKVLESRMKVSYASLCKKDLEYILQQKVSPKLFQNKIIFSHSFCVVIKLVAWISKLYFFQCQLHTLHHLGLKWRHEVDRNPAKEFNEIEKKKLFERKQRRVFLWHTTLVSVVFFQSPLAALKFEREKKF